MSRHDVAVIGAGIAGATLAAELAPHVSVVILEAEDQPGYHSTGRSAAFWAETYGGPKVQPLTTASGTVFRAHGWMETIGSLKLGRAGDEARIEQLLAEFAQSGVALHRVDPRDHLPGLRPGWIHGLIEPSCAYIDVAAIHGAALATARRSGARIETRARVEAITRDGYDWVLTTRSGSFRAGIIANAAGAWADPVAAMAGARPLGITPYRRTLVQLRTDPAPPADLPHVSHIAGSFYFKREGADGLWLSPHDETPDVPRDVAPEELDVAIAIDRFEQAVDWRVAAVERRWAGLRSFAPDRLPVYGFDHNIPGLFWCAGQGGWGIQTAPAAGAMAAALLLGRALPDWVRAADPDAFSPARFSD